MTLGWRFQAAVSDPALYRRFRLYRSAADRRDSTAASMRSPAKDDRRDEKLRRQGWRLLRFWNNEVFENRAGVLQKISDTLGPWPSVYPHPFPPPQAGEGVPYRGFAISIPSPACGGGLGWGHRHVPHRHRCRRHLYRSGRDRCRAARRPWQKCPRRRRTRRSACSTVSNSSPRASASTAPRCWRRPTASCTARPSRPTRCSNARAPGSGLLTTEGHRDVIEMREGLKDDRYNLRMPPPEQLVPRRLRLGVRERMRADGRIEIPLDPASLDAAIAVLQQEQVEAVAVCYLHAWRDPRHEHATAEALQPRAARRLCLAVLARCCRRSRSSSGSRRRWSTPMSARCCRAIWRGSKPGSAEAGYQGPTLIIQSHGGVAPIAEAGRLAAGAVLSGPAGGVAGSVYAAPPASGQSAGPDPVRHGRHLDRHQPGGGRRGGAGHEPQGRRPPHRAEQPRHRQHRRRRRLDRAGRCRRHPACRAGKRRRGAGTGLLRPGRRPRDRHRRQPRARLSRPGQFSRRRPAARSRGGRARRRCDRCRARHRPDRGGIAASTASSTRTWPRGCGSSRCGAASIRGGSRCSRSAARPGLHATDIARQLGLGAGRRAARRGGAVGLGDAGDRSALRGVAHAISATPARSTAPRSSTCSTIWRPRACAGCAPRSTGRRAPAARPTCAMASRSSRSPCRSTTWTGPPPTRCRRSSSAFTAATRRSTPIRCRTRKACWSTRA